MFSVRLNFMIIYKILNKINGMIYIGQTTRRLEERWKGHISCSKRSKTPLSQAIKYFGFENFEVSVLEEICDNSKKTLNMREVFWIHELKSLNPNGYNATTGGSGEYLMSEEARERLSKSCKGRPSNNLGKKHSDETRKKISESQKGKTHSKETREKISKAGLGRESPIKGKKLPELRAQRCREIGFKKGNEPWNKGTPQDDVAKFKNSMSQPNRKMVLCIDTGEVFSSASEASRKLGVNRGNLSNVCRGNGCYKSVGGLHFRYTTVEELTLEKKEENTTGE
jgi:group I intron endonuclease